MDEAQVEQTLRKLRDRIPVNRELKQRLRAALIRQRQRQLALRWSIGSTAAAVFVLIASLGLPWPGGGRVDAASLKVRNQVSFADLGAGSPLGAAEYKGTVYVPVAGKGLFAYDAAGFRQLTTLEIGSIRIDNEGKRLLGSAGGTVGIYDLASQTWIELLRSDPNGTYYEDPCWKDKNTILFVKKTVQSSDVRRMEVTESGIYEYDLATKQSRKLADGTSPTYSAKTDTLVYQKETENGPKVVSRSMKRGQETELDAGRFPSISPEGEYVAYVKQETARRTLRPNVYVEESVDNVWVADSDGHSRRAVTANAPQAHAPSEQEGMEPPASVDKPQVLVYSGMYSYYNPVWSSRGEDELYVIKNRNIEGSQMNLTRLDFSGESLKPSETVLAYNRAVIARDLDFAQSLLKNREDLPVIVSNPHQVSFQIVGSGKEAGKDYVDTEEYSAYTANPHYSISRARYYLVPGEHGYLIDEVKPTGGLLVSQKPDDAIWLEQEGGDTKLFAPGDIPNDIRPAGKFRIASLAYLEKRHRLLFAIQLLSDPGIGQQASVRLVGYDTQNNKFELLRNITSIGTMDEIGVENIIVSPDGRFAALDLFSDLEPASRSHVFVLDLNKKSGTFIGQSISRTKADAVHTFYWDGDNLHFTLKSMDQTMRFVWDAAKQRVDKP